MTDPRRIPILRNVLQGSCVAPPSKSATHRALVLAALANGVSTLERPLEADDTLVTRDGLDLLGISSTIRDNAWDVHGTGGRILGGARIELKESGSSCRFLAAVAALGEHPSRLDGTARLRQRPMSLLTEGLISLGGRCVPESTAGQLPLWVGGKTPAGGAIVLPTSPSSQFVSALLMIGSRLPAGLRLEVTPPLVSQGYVDMTVEMLRSCGGVVEVNAGIYRVHHGDLKPRRWVIEGDYSSASYFLAAGALLGEVSVEGLREDSHQPDARLLSILQEMGCRVRHQGTVVTVGRPAVLRSVQLDLSDAPDVVPTVSILAMFAEGETRLSGLRHLRVKESDRLQSLADNLNRLGARTTIEDDALLIHPSPAEYRGAVIATGGDHRIAMAFAIVGLRVAGVTVDDAACVAKSNPYFWNTLDRLLEPGR